jgi:hypothetical protein
MSSDLVFYQIHDGKHASQQHFPTSVNCGSKMNQNKKHELVKIKPCYHELWHVFLA